MSVKTQKVPHKLLRVFDKDSRILILGSFSSVASRKADFYYCHPGNRFWRLLATCLGEKAPTSNEEKRALALRHGIALYDSIEECTILGSSDSSIRDVVPADLSPIYKAGKIETIIFNGRAAEKFFFKYQKAPEGVKTICLPSTSPANAAWNFDRLLEVWSSIIKSGEN